MIFIIAHKELKTLFASPLAWTLLALMQLVLAWVFLGRLDAFLEMQPQLLQIANPPGVTEIIAAPVFPTAAVVFMMATPLLTMRLIAEERQNHTMTFLISAPISMTEIVLGKFLGLMVFFSAVIALVVALSISLLAGGSTLDFGLLLSNTAGLFLVAACFASLGLFMSCLTAQPAIAAAGALGALLVLWAIDITTNNIDSIAQDFSLFKHYENFNGGMIGTFDLVYFMLFTTTFLGLSIRRLDGERLRG
jgi:ABC-2 type transport system permease protein